MSFLELKLYLCAVVLLAFPSTQEGALHYDAWLSTLDGTIEWTPDLVALNKTTLVDESPVPSSAPAVGQLEHPFLELAKGICADFATEILCTLMLLLAVLQLVPSESNVGRLSSCTRHR